MSAVYFALYYESREENVPRYTFLVKYYLQLNKNFKYKFAYTTAFDYFTVIYSILYLLNFPIHKRDFLKYYK